MFLTDAQIRRLTGLREKGAQAEWLASHHVRHWVNAAGKPIVPCSEIETPGSAKIPAAGWVPDFTKIEAQ